MEYWNTYKTKIGTLIIVEKENRISRIETLKTNKEYPKGEKNETPLIKEAYKQISEYLEGKRKEFKLPLLMEGTKFQEKVWNALLQIPYGETRTYGEIAKQIRNEKASRAVGGANHNNHIIIVVPCHRVIGSNNKLVGYAEGLDIKEKLLRLEQQNKDI